MAALGSAHQAGSGELVSSLAVQCYAMLATRLSIYPILLCTCQCVPPVSPSWAARDKTKGFDISLSKILYLGAKFLIKSPYLQHSTVNITTDLWLSDHSQTCLEPIQVKGEHVKCPTLGEGPFINPLVKASHRPRRGIVGDLIDKCITNRLLVAASRLKHVRLTPDWRLCI